VGGRIKNLHQRGGQNMLFEPMFFVAGAITIGAAVLDKIFESYGYYFVGNVLKFIIPLAGLLTGIYFLENNPIIWWLK